MITDSVKPMLVVSSNYRLFVADGAGVGEVHLPTIAKSLYLMLLRHPEGIAFDDSFVARKELINAHYDITHCPLDECELRHVLDLTEPPMGNISAMCEVIRQAFASAVGEERAAHYVVDCSNPCAVRVALPAESVVW